MKNLEHQIQASFFSYLELQYPKLRKKIFAIPNGGARNVITGAMLKKEGATAGVFDVFVGITNPSRGLPGLFIEFKAGKNKLSEKQKDFMGEMISEGYECETCYSLEEAIKCLNDYLKPKEKVKI